LGLVFASGGLGWMTVKYFSADGAAKQTNQLLSENEFFKKKGLKK
jgi:hypothetical protein